ncbi:RidA family protein [Natronoglycomyces albus]|uniref:RidA family protein n=1 Tax=Natronoglycomyces albus TaxID=2811108 RepID=A0A895XM51_9ACTN|nr:RidA family protein [Natronoglycomyces albus]QSB04055.1 RidA family protein [Natronoglycomyces albus]
MTDKTAIHTTSAPAPAHTFPQGVRKGPLLQVSGQGPVDPATGTYLYPGDVKAQTTRTLDNVLAILNAGGASLDDVIMLRVYLTDRADFAAMNEAYGAFVTAHTSKGTPLPCRTTVMTGLPREEMLVEIDALAVVN